MATKDPPADPSKEDAPQGPGTTAGRLAHDANFNRQQAQALGFDQDPGLGTFVSSHDEPALGENLATLMPSARAHGHPDLPETEIRPPDFLTRLEAMSDVYMQIKGRVSRRTKELLEGPDLEDLLDYLARIHDDEQLAKHPEGRILGVLYQELKDEPGPLILGLGDPRTTELWRLFLDGWDIWVPDGEETGVELFWEGEAEDDDGHPLEILQSLVFIPSEVTLYTRLGDKEDTLTFDGEAFYRLKTARRGPK